ncbi:sun family protein [Parvularcula bermudensis HTCC2503]|uniref:Sun family protein n=1 Tax=Parvularcula bermudensis (strain ATCC BAA-594 / HTCC2503 / KCTC 12087) TaxID=314260 RepID=E0THU8_PARBH|nr:RsmB/NOP family class I SAM-dependent RNA methyltransferase [Parvularcula bermudensis]ADM10241.1 sun family protein [Parvularcula bermudensis HTCC2503]
MRDAGRIAAALDVLAQFEARRVPIKVCLADWARGARYAGAKDRAFIGGVVHDALRYRRSLELDTRPRIGIGRVLMTLWGWPEARLVEAFAETPHGPGALSAEEIDAIAEGATLAARDVRRDWPEFALPLLERVNDNPTAEIEANRARAPVDLRVNTLRSDLPRTEKALRGEGAVPAPLAALALRCAVPAAERRGPAIEITPAFQKGWVEIQDEGSQLAALAMGDLAGGQILDFCAGAGGKTLAMAAHLDNRGQVFAYDIDARRLAPLYDRARRAGVRNVQVLSPTSDAARLGDLTGKMDGVFVDAPCSGAGTWRRRPDTKWRLTPDQLATRQEEQDRVLDQAEAFVRPGGILVYVTCSIFAEENEDRIAAFLDRHPTYDIEDPGAAITASGGVHAGAVLPPADGRGTLRLSPAKTATDGFAITRLRRRG